MEKISSDSICGDLQTFGKLGEGAIYPSQSWGSGIISTDSRAMNSTVRNQLLYMRDYLDTAIKDYYTDDLRIKLALEIKTQLDLILLNV